MSQPKVPTPIVDKNGKRTTVHKNADKPDAPAKNRIPQVQPATDFSQLDERQRNTLNRLTQDESVNLDNEWTHNYRIPMVTDLYNNWKFQVALVQPGESPWGGYLEATEDEVKAISAYLEYTMRYYNQGWRNNMEKLPVDIDGSVNTVVFAKTPRGWVYRRSSWTSQVFSPRIEERQFESILDLIDQNVAGHSDGKGGFVQNNEWLGIREERGI